MSAPITDLAALRKAGAFVEALADLENRFGVRLAIGERVPVTGLPIGFAVERVGEALALTLTAVDQVTATSEPVYENASTELRIPVDGESGEVVVSIIVSWPLGSAVGLAAAAVALPDRSQRVLDHLARRAVEYLHVDEQVADFAALLAGLPETEGPK